MTGPCQPGPAADAPTPTLAGADSARPAWLWPGARKLGRYWLGPLLGRGGMGEVYEAWDTLLGRRVAVKILSAPLPGAIQRFLLEAQLQARVSHPNVCRVYDVDAGQEVPFIAMQLVQGPNLWQAAPNLTRVAAVEILAAVALAINAAHRLNLIHRDLKPTNILLEPDDMGGWSSYVADFGLAKDLTRKGLTETQGVVGTPEYMAPEAKSGEAQAMGPAADIYALGVTLEAVLDRIPDPEAPASGTPLPRKLRTIIARCREERPQDRYVSAGELAEDLRRFLDGEPLLAERGEWRRQAQRCLRRHPTWTTLIASTLVLGAGFGLWAGQLSARGQRQAALAQRFALDARDLENRMRVERLIPVHDLRPTLTQMRQHLERVKASMARLGPEALGPGCLALGRGYCALGDLDQAQAVLERAWNAGYHTPEVAYTLSRVACEHYFALVLREDTQDQEGSLETQKDFHRKAARSYFERSAGQTWEPVALGEARLLYVEGRFEEALAQARTAFKDNGWLYEAKTEEAYALAALGFENQRRGELAAALSRYREASLAAQWAQTIGHSDGNCYFADLEWRLYWVENPNLTPAERLAELAEAERLADRVLVIQPDCPRALLSKSYVILTRAALQAASGRDPEPELMRAERILAPAGGSATQEGVALKRKQMEAVRARFRQQTRDP